MTKFKRIFCCAPLLFIVLLFHFTLLLLVKHSEATSPASSNTTDLAIQPQVFNDVNNGSSKSPCQQVIPTNNADEQTSNSSLAVDFCLDVLITAKDTSDLQLSQNSLEEKCPNLPIDAKEKLIQIIEVQKNNSTGALLNPIVKNAKIAEFMVKFGADPNVKDDNDNSVLHLAAKRGNLQVVDWVLTNTGLDINSQNIDGNTALHLASDSLESNPDTITYLINTTNINAILLNKNNETALKVATSSINIQDRKIIALIESGKFTDHVSESIRVILFNASKRNDTEIVQWVINNYPNQLNTVDDINSNALHQAVFCNRLEILKMLVETDKFNINDKQNNDTTPLHIAAELGYFEIIKYLIEEKHADYKLKTLFKRNILQIAVSYNHFEITKYLIENYDFNVNEIYYKDRNILLDACEGGYLDILKYLVYNASVELNVTYYRIERNILHLAVSKGQLNIVKFLIEDLKFDVNSKSYFKETALHLAALNGQIEIAKYLVEVGKVDVCVLTLVQMSALDVAQQDFEGDKTEIVALLQKYETELCPNIKRNYDFLR